MTTKAYKCEIHDVAMSKEPVMTIERLKAFDDAWAYASTDESGQWTEVRGCDLFEFEGGKIKRKNVFRKCSS